MLRVHPNYLAYFNEAAGGPSRGWRWLVDSNIDWGQDLPLLAKWQREHPDRPVHLKYFGTVEPELYVDVKPLSPPTWPASPDR